MSDAEGDLLFALDDKTEIRADIGDFEGQRYFSVRKWICKKDGTWVRTRNGISVPANKAVKLSSALAKYIDQRRRK